MSIKYAVRRERFQEIVSRFASKKIMILGDVGVDRYTIGSASRLSQEAPVPIVRVASVTDKLGMAANVADNLKSFGARPYITSIIGQDRVGDELLQLLEQGGVPSDYVFRHESRRTSLKERVIAQPQQVVRIDHEITDDLNAEAESFFLAKVLPLLPDFDGIILEDYAKGLLTDKVVREVIAAAKKEKKFISVDPPSQGRTVGVYRGVSIITPNTREAEILSGVEITDDTSLQKAGEKLLQDMELPIVVITRGKNGMTIFTREGKPLHVPTFARAVYDVSGAGDTVISMLSLALISGATLEEGALLANFAAGVEVGKQGTATVSIQELEQYMQMLGGLV